MRTHPVEHFFSVSVFLFGLELSSFYRAPPILLELRQKTFEPAGIAERADGSRQRLQHFGADGARSGPDYARTESRRCARSRPIADGAACAAAAVHGNCLVFRKWLCRICCRPLNRCCFWKMAAVLWFGRHEFCYGSKCGADGAIMRFKRGRLRLWSAAPLGSVRFVDTRRRVWVMCRLSIPLWVFCVRRTFLGFSA